ncbi:MAG: hypothetical protein JRL30_25670 [Deltaproteobacteria bacterium]|nr:hypothetical protein [Deltaproteobacteria bacterium]
MSVFDTDSRQITWVGELPIGHSIYSIDIDFENGMIALGTRGGLIEIVPDPSERESENGESRSLIQGAPLLSVCWAGKELLAASDNAGRSLLWKTDQETVFGSLQVTGGPICCMTRLYNDILAGLSSTGVLHLWHLSDQKLFRVINCPSPPPIKGLVKMVYWPSRQALAWPGQEGSLNLFDIETEQIVQIGAHIGDFYAISPQDDNLITIGMGDGRLKIWTADALENVQDHAVPCGAISAAIAEGTKTEILIIKRNGTATLYSHERDALRFRTELPGKNYRTAKSYACEITRSYSSRERTMEVEKIISDIRSGNGRVGKEVIEVLHSRLIDLGYEHVSLAIRAEEASQRGDIVEGLKLRYCLIELLPGDAKEACPAMEEYAAILQRAWHLDEAESACKHIQAIDPNYQFTINTTRIKEMASKITETECLIDPDIPIEQIISTATHIGKPFSGRYLINELPLENSRIRLDPEVIQKKYEHVRKENPGQGLPAAVLKQLTRISGEEICISEYVVFEDEKENDLKGLQMALQILPTDLGTVVTPMILFDWRNGHPEETVQKRNERAEKALHNIRKNASSDPYLSALYRATKHALRRAFTEKSQQEGFRP